MERISMHLRVLMNQPFLPQDLTQYNTAHNRQISMVGIQEDERPRKRRYRANSVSFSDQEEIINPGTCLCVRGVCVSVVGGRGYKIRMPFGCKLASCLHSHTTQRILIHQWASFETWCKPPLFLPRCVYHCGSCFLPRLSSQTLVLSTETSLNRRCPVHPDFSHKIHPTPLIPYCPLY